MYIQVSRELVTEAHKNEIAMAQGLTDEGTPLLVIVVAGKANINKFKEYTTPMLPGLAKLEELK